jgi:hypothetical protein
MKKAQAQTITFILAIITGALILLFGIKVLLSVSGDADAMKIKQFKIGLAQDIGNSAVQFGSYLSKAYDVPKYLSEVCFSAQSDTASSTDCSTLQEYPLIKDALEDNVGSNVFILGKSPESFYIPYIDTGACRLKCIKPKNGKLGIVLEGKGNGTLIS